MGRAVVVANLVERDHELAHMRVALERASAGAGSLIVIEGEAGAGRSRLLRAACDTAARSGFSVMSTFAGDTESDLAFAVVRQLLDRTVSKMSADERARLLSGPARPAAAVLAAGDDAGDGASGPVGSGTAIDHALCSLVAKLSERQPLLLAIDDVQWSDAPSLRFLRYLTRRLAELSVVVVLAARRDEACVDRRSLLELAAAPAATVLTPAALTMAGTRQLLGLLVRRPAEGAAEACFEATGGNPFLLTELATTLDPKYPDVAAIGSLIPPTVARFVGLSLRRLGTDATALAHALVVLGEGTELRLLGKFVGIGMDSVFAAAASLMNSSILAEYGTTRFTYPIVRNAIAVGLSGATRAAMHRRAAQLLLSEDADVELVAGHLMATAPAGSPDFARSLRAAAAQARRRGAVATAVRYLTRALQEPPPAGDRGPVLAELGAAELHNADPAAALDHLRAGHRLATTADERAERALPLARAEAYHGSVAEAVRLLRESVAASGTVDTELARRLRGELGYLESRHRLVSPRSRDGFLTTAADYAGDTSGERVMLANVTLRELQAATAPAASVADVARRALRGDSLLRDLTADHLMYYVPGSCLVFADHPHDAVASFARALADAQARRSSFGSVAAYAHLALAARQHGAVTTAAEYGQLAWEAAVRLDSSAGTMEATTLAAREYAIALRHRGGLKQARDVLAHAFTMLPAAKAPGGGAADLCYARALCHAAAGCHDEARADLMTSVERAGAAEGWDPSFPWRADLAIVLSELGKDDEAIALAESQLAGARRWGAASAIGSALRVLAAVRPDAAVPLLREAVEALGPAPARLELARAMLDLGSALGDRDQAERLESLRAGRDLAHQCGARMLERRAHSKLRDVGARPRQPVYTGVQALTASERRVAEYAARGATNRQIAQHLFITTKTVESHLAATFRKLGISSRAHLRNLLTAGGPDSDRAGSVYYCSICQTSLPIPA